MITKTARWYETTVKYDSVQDNGKEASVTNTLSIDALSFAEAESKTINEIKDYVQGDCEVTKIVIAPYKEVFLSEKTDDDKFFRAKLQFITINELTGKEKKAYTSYLVQVKDFTTAKQYIEQEMSKTMRDYSIHSVVETNIMNVLT